MIEDMYIFSASYIEAQKNFRQLSRRTMDKNVPPELFVTTLLEKVELHSDEIAQQRNLILFLLEIYDDLDLNDHTSVWMLYELLPEFPVKESIIQKAKVVDSSGDEYFSTILGEHNFRDTLMEDLQKLDAQIDEYELYRQEANQGNLIPLSTYAYLEYLRWQELLSIFQVPDHGGVSERITTNARTQVELWAIIFMHCNPNLASIWKPLRTDPLVKQFEKEFQN